MSHTNPAVEALKHVLQYFIEKGVSHEYAIYKEVERAIAQAEQTPVAGQGRVVSEELWQRMVWTSGGTNHTIKVVLSPEELKALRAAPIYKEES